MVQGGSVGAGPLRQARRNPQGHLVLVLGRADWQSSPTHLLGPGGPHLAL